MAFHRDDSGEASQRHVWVCENAIQEELIEERVGEVQPGNYVILTVAPSEVSQLTRQRSSCWLQPDEIPKEWLLQFPSGEEIIRKSVSLQPGQGLDVDSRLLRRRKCEFEVFRSLEAAVELPHVQGGFATIEDFVSRAQTILQRRKSRSGLSLELHAREIFLEEQLLEGAHFQHQPESESGKRPDFLFPGEAAYKNPDFPVTRLRMLAAKTTCKDRWRQILNEAERIPQKHLLTLQEGVSEKQFQEMTAAGVHLVVPKPLVEKYPQSIQPHLQSLESFIGDIRLLGVF